MFGHGGPAEEHRVVCVELLQLDQDALSRILTGLDELEASTALSGCDESLDLVDLARLAT